MDTRNKILACGEDARDGNRKLAAVTGYFDVLTTSMVERVESVARNHPDHDIVAVVLEMDGALLAQRARAELAAGLQRVDHVLMAKTAAGALEILAPEIVVRDEDEQLADRRLLIRHVRNRYDA